MTLLGLGLLVPAAADSDRRVPRCNGKKATIVGTKKADVLRGTRKPDVIVAKGGNDRIVGRGGADVVCAGPGNDRVVSGGGKDWVSGGSGDDTLSGGSKVDRLFGEDGRDSLVGASGADTLDGGPGDDTLDAGTEADQVLAGDGNDTVLGGSGADVVDAGSGDDRVDAGTENDRVASGTGADSVVGGSGDDVLDAGAGDDTVEGGEGADQLLGGDGHDRLTDTSSGSDVLVGGASVDICTRTAGDSVDCDFDPSDPVVFVPHQGAPTPSTMDLAATSRIPAVDLYLLLDRSGTMTSEISAIKNNVAAVIDQIKCPPEGVGVPPGCVDDLWAGAGTFAYAGSGFEAYRHFIDVQSDPSFASLPVTEPSGCCQEAGTFAAWSTITGGGGGDFGITGVPARASCATSPAATAGFGTFGYGCFRQGALPVVVLATDEGLLTGPGTYKVPSWTGVVAPAMRARGARVMGLLGSAPDSSTDPDLRTMAADTGAVDLLNGNAPIVVNGADSAAAVAMLDGLRRLINGTPLDVRGSAADDPSDALDAVGAFVSRVETAAGGAECAAAAEGDLDSDGYPDTYRDVAPNTGLCWRLVVKTNTTVLPAATDQVFRATVDVALDDVGTIERREVFFVVPHP